MAEKRIALLAPAWPTGSRTMGIADRFLVGYPWNGRWHRPEVKVASAHVPAGAKAEDLAASRGKEFGFPIFPNVTETLRVGGGKVAIDGVLIVAAAGTAEDFLAPMLDALEKDRVALPIFVVGQTARTHARALEFAASARKSGATLLAGSALPFAVRLPALDVAVGAKVDEVLCVDPGGSETDGLDALETVLAVVEKRRGGGKGVKAVQTLDGEAIWHAIEERRIARALLAAALSRSDSPQGLTITDGRTQDLTASDLYRQLATRPRALCVEHTDGARSHVLALEGVVKDFNLAVRANGKIQSCQVFVGPPPNVTETIGLTNQIENFFLSGKAPFPAGRAPLVTGIREAAQKSIDGGFVRVETRHLSR